ncbi:hypothetical protein NS115_03825 [Paenibacillus jamilae]|uniref:Uncharacterized protein n=2 Tax=Paenibacillus jamilae TaxID=114136 RepID=A0ACC4ZZS7_9BACL|nr:hypothetical protein NS115_03825 [Paenibacillus jamilae]
MYVVGNIEIHHVEGKWATRPVGSEFEPAPGDPATILRFVLACYEQAERNIDTFSELLMQAYRDAEESERALKSGEAEKADHIQGGF